MVTILNGRETSTNIMEELTKQINEIKAQGINPTLALVLTGTDKYSQRYVKMKARRAGKIGIETRFHHLEKPTQEELISLINKLNEDSSVHGIMVQLPLADGLNELETVDEISPDKDVDGLSPSTLGKILMGEECYLPAGVEAIMELLKRYNIGPEKKHWVIIGMSNIIGKPLAAHLGNINTQVTFCQKDDPEFVKYVNDADILVTDVFKKHLISADMVKKGVVVIDNGNNYEGKKVFGDVDTEAVSKVASAITPVPGGVGPLLITMLLQNTVKAASKLRV